MLQSATPHPAAVDAVLTEPTVAEFLARSLAELGVRYVFGIVGHSIFHITDALYRQPGIEFIPTQGETAAAYMAEGFARAGRQLGVCLVSAGPGAVNALGGVAHGHKEGTPLLTISSDVTTRVAGKIANWHEVDQQALFAPLTRRSVTVRTPEDVPAELAACLAVAHAPRGGPVYLGIPSDLLNSSLSLPPRRERAGVSEPEPTLAAAREMLERARRPVVLAGEGVFWAGAEAEARQLAERLQAPFGTPYSQKGLLDETHPLSLGVVGSGAAPWANRYVQESDLIVALGVSFGEGLTLGYGHRLIPEDMPILQIDAAPERVPHAYPATVVKGDLKAILVALLDGLPQADWPTQLAADKAAWRHEIAARQSGVIDYWAIQRALREAIADDTMVVGAVTERMLQRFVATSKVFHTSDFRAIGHGLATAIGVKFACPERQLVCLTGDGSFMMELPELATLARYELAIPIVVVHNNAYGSMKHDQLRLFDGRFSGTDLHAPDFCQVAAAFGIPNRRVDSAAELTDAIRQTVALGKPALLDVVCPIEGF